MTTTARTILAAVLTLAGLAATAAAVPVTFHVDMSHQTDLGAFDPAFDFVDLAGTFNDWGTNPLTPLADPDGDLVYSIQLFGFAPGETIEYKFRINGLWDGTEEFPGVGSNRIAFIVDGENVLNHAYNDFVPVVHDPADLDWWNDVVFYEVFVRSFQDSDGDGIGDLDGLTSRLDYLVDLGVGALWLMPINDSPSYHGYDATDYRVINPDYGTMADFQEFLTAAHDRGLKVIVDYVMNHCSTQHPWFLASSAGDPAYRDWFRWRASDPGWGGWHRHASGWYYGLFWSGMPDLNYDHPPVRQSMFETAAWWLEDVGVDGFRLDAVLYIDENDGWTQSTPETFAFWRDFQARVQASDPDALTVGEAWTGTSTVVRYLTEGDLDLCFEFELSYAMLGAVHGADASWLRTKAAQVHALYPFNQFATFLTNHDQDRTMTVLGFESAKARAAAGLYLTLPGVPFVYYGEEIGMTGNGDHLNIRTPMQWTPFTNAGFTTGTPWHPVNGDASWRNVADQASDPGSVLNTYKALIAARGESTALRRGALEVLGASADEVFAHLRTARSEMVLCLTNVSGLALADVDVSGSPLPPGEYVLESLLSSGLTFQATVTPEGSIGGLALDPYETEIWRFASGTGVEDVPTGDPPRALRIRSASPNPFNPSVEVLYALTVEGQVRIAVYDAAGREVAVLLESEERPGEGRVEWDGRDRQGRAAGAGCYVIRAEAGGTEDRIKVTLLK